MTDQEPPINPFSKVIIESVRPAFVEYDTTEAQKPNIGVIYNTRIKDAGFLITTTAQILLPATSNRKECVFQVEADYYVEVRDRRIFVKENQKIATKLIAELGCQTYCYTQLYGSLEFEKRNYPKLEFVYLSLTQFYPLAEEHLNNTPLYRNP